jgi:hypothetical protein
MGGLLDFDIPQKYIRRACLSRPAGDAAVRVNRGLPGGSSDDSWGSETAPHRHNKAHRPISALFEMLTD